MKENTSTHILSGKKIVSTRPKGKSEELKNLLENAGAEMIEIPAIETKVIEWSSELEEQFIALDQYTWLIMTSANAVNYLMQLGKNMVEFDQKLKGLKVAAIGKKTAGQLATYQIQPDFIADKANSVDFAIEFKAHLNGQEKLFWPTSNRTEGHIAKALKSVAEVNLCVIYETIAPESIKNTSSKDFENNADAILFYSPSAFENFMNRFSGETPLKNAASIGPITTKSMQKRGINPIFEAKEQSDNGMFEALISFFEENQKH